MTFGIVGILRCQVGANYVYTPILAHYRQPALAAISSMLVLAVWESYLCSICFGYMAAPELLFIKYGQPPQYAIGNQGRVSAVWKVIAVFLTVNFVILSFTFTGTESFEDSVSRWKILLGIEY